ncbi:24929_t:CDS:2 [Cetraspora pellucida]|uniref:24929_t:CDS:1 n=1 Tax=Cetraspora pellucida TaxID=1433469 RepID=A0A9N9JCH4_9GLOM|nr:24929_t:CDS:2 [Cetraspora pellucida]
MGKIHSKSSRVQNIPQDQYKRSCSLASISSLGSSNTTLAYEDTSSIKSLGSSKSVRSLDSSNATIACTGDTKSTIYIGDMHMYGKNEAQRYDECDRLNVIHFLIRNLWESNFSAPIEGLLTHSQAKSEFHGIDILPLYPQSIKPNNITFSKCNILQRLPYDDNVFDYVHMRFMGSSLTLSAWEYVVNELVRVLKPGGYVEICELDCYWVNEGPKARMLRSQKLIGQFNICLIASPLARRALQGNDRLTDFHQMKKDVPMGGWGGTLGDIFLENAKWFVKNLGNAVDSLGMSNERYEAIIDSAINEIELKGNVFDTIHRFWAKKL